MKRLLLIISAVVTVYSHILAQGGQDAELTRLNAELSKAYAAGNYETALTFATKIVEISRQSFGKEGRHVASPLKNLGFVQMAKGDGKAGQKTLEEAVSIFKKYADLNQAEGSAFASALETVAAIKMQGETSAGEENLELALKWREKSNGPDSASTATTLATLANVKFWKRDYPAAAAFYKRALLIMAKTTKDLTEDNISIVYERAKCSFRKAKSEQNFGDVETEYKSIINSRSDVKKATFVTGGVLNGKATFLAKPTYPDDAKKVRAGGAVAVQVLINEKGRVLSACAVPEANQLFAESVEIAALKSTYSPTLLAGTPVKVSGLIVYNFVP